MSDFEVDWSNPLINKYGVSVIVDFSDTINYARPLDGVMSNASPYRLYNSAYIAGDKLQLSGSDITSSIQCLYLDNKSDYHAGDMTIIARCKPSSALSAANRQIFSSDDSLTPKREWQFRLTDTNNIQVISFVGASNASATSLATVNFDVFNDVACSHSSTLATNNVRVILNGEAAYGTIAGTLNIYDAAKVIGARANDSADVTVSLVEAWGDELDFIYMFKGVLTYQEIQSIFDNPKSLLKPIKSVQTNSIYAALFPVAAGIIVPVGVVYETNSALAIGKLKSKSVGIVIENDAALPLGTAQIIPVGIVSEIDAALVVSALKNINIGVVSENDTILPVAKNKSLSVGMVTESDTALSLTSVKLIQVGVVAEVTSALPLTSSKLIALGIVSEIDSVYPVGYVKTAQVGIVTEADQILSIYPVGSNPVGVVSEIDSLLPVDSIKDVNVGIVSEADTLLPILKGQDIPVGMVTEADSTNSVGILKIYNVGSVSEISSILPITRVKTTPVGMVQEVDVTLHISKLKQVSVGTVSELNQLLSIGKLKTVAVGTVSELDSILPIVIHQVVPVGMVIESDLLLPVLVGGSLSYIPYMSFNAIIARTYNYTALVASSSPPKP